MERQRNQQISESITFEEEKKVALFERRKCVAKHIARIDCDQVFPIKLA